MIILHSLDHDVVMAFYLNVDFICFLLVISIGFYSWSISSQKFVKLSCFYFCSVHRNLDVAEDNDIGKDADEDGEEIISGLQCKIVVRFEKYRDFYDALKILCGRSLQKVGLIVLQRWMEEYFLNQDNRK